MEGKKEIVEMKALKNTVERLFTETECSAEYKAVMAEALALRWRAIADNEINLELAKREAAERKENEHAAS